MIEAALKLCSGKPIINSINLEDGRKTLDQDRSLAKKYGAALVALTIDEKGQADTAEWKFEVAEAHLRHRRRTSTASRRPTCCSTRSCSRSAPGRSRRARARIATFEAIRLIKQNLPGALTHVGLSNCSASASSPYTRQVRQQRLPALRARVRARLGDPARGQDHAAGAHRRDGQGTLPPAAVRRARSTPPGTAPKTRCNCSSSTTPTRRPSRRRGQSLGDTVEERLRAGDHPGPPRDAHRRPRRGPRAVLAASTSSTRSCSTA